MPPKRSITLTEAELRIMRILWVRGESLVSELVEAMPESTPLAYTSVLTTVRILEQKGFVAHEEAGRAFVYHPLVARDAAAQTAVGHLVSRFFENSSGSLALRLIESERPSDDELSRLRALIERYEERSS